MICIGEIIKPFGKFQLLSLNIAASKTMAELPNFINKDFFLKRMVSKIADSRALL